MSGKKDFKLIGYVEVKDRIKAFLESENHQGWYFLTEIIDNARPKGVVNDDGLNDSQLGYIQMKAIVYDKENNPRSTGYAQEVEGIGMVNKTSYLENCETSAIGRALGMLGFGIEKSIASKEEIDRAKSSEQPMFEVYEQMAITEEEAKGLIGTSIKELIAKLGARKEDLANLYDAKTMGGKASNASITQLMNLEKELRTANNETSEWHSIYAQNSRVKDPVPLNQEIVYTSSKIRYALKAYEMAQDDDTRLDIIKYYQDGGYDISKLVI
jgi:hypothetical protein